MQVGLQLCRGVDKLNSVVGDCVFNVFATNILVRKKVFKAFMCLDTSCHLLFNATNVFPKFLKLSAIIMLQKVCFK